MQERFVELKDQFSKFVGSFSAWVNSRLGENEVEQKITRKDLYAHISKLDKKITWIGTAIKVVVAMLPIGALAVPWLFPSAIMVCHNYSCFCSVILKVSRRQLSLLLPASSSSHGKALPSGRKVGSFSTIH
jgi:hypothetical protein